MFFSSGNDKSSRYRPWWKDLLGWVQKVHAISKLKGQDFERKRLWVNRSLDGIACIYMFVCVVVKLAAQLDCHPKNSEIYNSKALVLAIQAIIVYDLVVKLSLSFHFSGKSFVQEIIEHSSKQIVGLKATTGPFISYWVPIFTPSVGTEVWRNEDRNLYIYNLS